jgi:hypothetical protein
MVYSAQADTTTSLPRVVYVLPLRGGGGRRRGELVRSDNGFRG